MEKSMTMEQSTHLFENKYNKYFAYYCKKFEFLEHFEMREMVKEA